MVSKKDINVPNLISLSRIIFLIIFVYSFFRGNIIIMISSVVISGLSDMMDGYIARKYNMVTILGNILDKTADKLTQITIAVCISTRTAELVPMLIIFLSREAFMMFGDLIAAKIKREEHFEKRNEMLSTIAFFLSCGIMIFSKTFCKNSAIAYTFAWISITITVIIMIISMIIYFMSIKKIFED